MQRLSISAGAALILIGAMLLAASIIGGRGEGSSWDRADAFAEESRQPANRAGMLLAAVGLAALVAVSPIVVVRLHGTPGFALAVAAWVAFAVSAALFLMIIGLVTIALPALGELSARGEISPQQVVDEFVRQPGITVAFLGANGLYLSWLMLGLGVVRSRVFARWVGWTMMAAAVAGWLSFLHVPVVEQFGGELWIASIVLLGLHLLRSGLPSRT